MASPSRADGAVDLEFDEDQFPGGGMYLMASVIEQFLALYVTMNSFTQARP